MPFLLFVVKKAYKGVKGLNIAPGIQLKDNRPEVQSITQGMELELRYQNDQSRRTNLITYGIPVEKDANGNFIIYGKPEDQYIIFTLPETLTPDDVPTGTEIWTVT
ncbi:MAG TPA: hypothetical protein VJ785_04200 [Anaerolineales bacterium]|nr:hypothetical protein [Anaerolineales bacterium]